MQTVNIAPAGVMVGFKKRKVANGANNNSTERNLQDTVKSEPIARELPSIVENEAKEFVPKADTVTRTASSNTHAFSGASEIAPSSATNLSIPSPAPAPAPPRPTIGISLSMKKPGAGRILKPAFGADE